MNETNQQKGLGIQVRDLKKSYGSNQVLKGLNFEVKPGEIFVIMGPSGSGKTVLLKQLIGLEQPDSGQVLVNGQPMTSIEHMEKFRMAMVFQSGALLNSLTVGENVALYLVEHRLKQPEEIRRIVSEKLEAVGLKGAEDKMPGDLSGGMKKRAALARALVIEPQLLLYDEPTSELDPLSAVRIAEEIVKLNQRIGVTSVVVTHDREMAFGIAHRIGFITEGQMRVVGTPAEIKAMEDPKLKEFLNASFEPSVK